MEHDNLQEKPRVKNRWAPAIAIIFAGVLISVAIYSTGKQIRGTSPSNAATEPSIENVAPVGSNDHVFGNPAAPVKVVEFSDTECPFCKRFHPTMQQIMRDYGANGSVAWVYRHFPIDQLHTKARTEAAATECANELGGNKKFWEYLDRLFSVTPSNDNLDLAELPRIAEYMGLDRVKFDDCMQSGKYAQHIQDDLDDAVRSGGAGTPYTIVVAANGKKFVISGAQSYAVVASVLDAALQEK